MHMFHCGVVAKHMVAENRGYTYDSGTGRRGQQRVLHVLHFVQHARTHSMDCMSWRPVGVHWASQDGLHDARTAGPLEDVTKSVALEKSYRRGLLKYASLQQEESVWNTARSRHWRQIAFVAPARKRLELSAKPRDVKEVIRAAL